MENILPILVADAPDALVELCGVNLVERLLRILQRLGFRRAIVFSSTPEIIGAELAKRSWAREQITTQLVPTAAKPVTAHRILEQGQTARFLIVPANVYCDGAFACRLVGKELSDRPCGFQSAAVRPRHDPKSERACISHKGFSSGAFDQLRRFLRNSKTRLDNRQIDIVDAAKEDDYIVSMRRRVRPLCFSAPPEQSRRVAERVILDSAQNGTLDLPAYIHGPIETAIISLLCKTRITPNQITIGGFVIGCSATAAFVVGRVGLGILAALIFGIVDGLDGKLSRVKIETTERGKWEHHLDYLIENSWWLAIAFHLWRSGQFPNVFYFLALLIASHLLAEFAKRRVKIARGRLLDDVAPFDRAFRLIAARRNVYVWILACGFLLGAFPQSYAIICGWAAVSAAVHLTRSVWICNALRRRVVDSRA